MMDDEFRAALLIEKKKRKSTKRSWKERKESNKLSQRTKEGIEEMKPFSWCSKPNKRHNRPQKATRVQDRIDQDASSHEGGPQRYIKTCGKYGGLQDSNHVNEPGG